MNFSKIKDALLKAAIFLAGTFVQSIMPVWQNVESTVRGLF